MRPWAGPSPISEARVYKESQADNIEKTWDNNQMRELHCLTRLSEIALIRQQAIHGREIPSGRSDSKARTPEKCSTVGNLRISCVIKQKQPTECNKIDINRYRMSWKK